MWAWLPWVAWARLKSDVSRLTSDVCQLNETLVATRVLCTERLQASEAAIRDMVADAQTTHDDVTTLFAALDQRLAALTDRTELSRSAVTSDVARLTSDIARLTSDVTQLNETLVDSDVAYAEQAQAAAGAASLACAQRADEHDAAIRDVMASVQATRDDATTQCAAVDHRVAALAALTELSLSAVRARDAWTQAFETSAAAAGVVFQQDDANLGRAPETPTAGWRHVLQDTDGAVVSVRQARHGQAPTRIERGHGRRQSWYRLTRVEGLALIYTPEPELS